MFVEATRMGGEGQLTLTGQLGKILSPIYTFSVSLLCFVQSIKKIYLLLKNAS